jgi:hypothetical protein
MKPVVYFPLLYINALLTPKPFSRFLNMCRPFLDNNQLLSRLREVSGYGLPDKYGRRDGSKDHVT